MTNILQGFDKSVVWTIRQAENKADLQTLTEALESEGWVIKAKESANLIIVASKSSNEKGLNNV